MAQPRPRVRGRVAAQAWEQLVLPMHAARLRAPLVFSPANLAPLAWPRNVVVIHDAAALRHANAYSPPYRLWHARAGRAATRRALTVVTVSEFSRRELLELGNLDPARVVVIPGGVGDQFRPAAADTGDDGQQFCLGLGRPYVLTIATADARKNLRALAPAAATLRRLGVDLAWAGDARPYFTDTPPVAGLRRLGYVAERDLPGLYRGALAFVLPSHYEGFGLTCLEAMASGIPVVAADRAALPETCGGAALLVDPDDPEAIAAALVRAATEPDVRAALRQAGLRRAADFSWDRTASEVDALLTRLA